MALAIYIKETPKIHKPRNPKKERALFITVSAFGLMSLIFAAWPFFTWQFFTLSKFTEKTEDSPVPSGQVLSTQTIADSVQVVKDEDGFSYFVSTQNTKPTGPRPEEFFISIPRLEIEDALVKTDTLKFYENLSHFPGTALPGEVGNSFITGHSVLPQFANPKNYREIFTKLPNMEVGDDIYVNIENKKLHYVVQYYKVVDPKDISVLGPISAGGKNLTLMTCVPPGASTKRLVVIAGLI